ncbi:MAG: FMN-binding protein [Fibrobacter sp.]|nr:FMN-binding protein [Fibrobacter sp.]
MTVTTRNSIIIVAISVIMALICTTTYRLWKYKETVKSLTVQEPKLTDIADGEYEGEYDLSLVCAKVKVTINKGRIENIAILKHDNGRGKKAEKIIEDVIGQQKLGVNAITGATASSKAILKAIENALQDAETSD